MAGVTDRNIDAAVQGAVQAPEDCVMTQNVPPDPDEYARLVELWCEVVRDWDGREVRAFLLGTEADQYGPGNVAIPGLLEPWLMFMRGVEAAVNSDISQD